MAMDPDTPHYNDDGEHYPVTTTTYRDGKPTLVKECCACVLHDPNFVTHMATIPDSMYMTFIPSPTSVH